jgi:HK97 family phage major capsid protein
MKTKELMDARAVKLEALEALIATAEKENRDFTEEEQTSFDLLKKEIDELDAKVDRAKEIDAEKARIAASKRSTPRKSEAEKVAERFSLVSLIRSPCIKRIKTLTVPKPKLFRRLELWPKIRS